MKFLILGLILSFSWKTFALSHKEFVQLPRDQREKVIEIYKQFLADYAQTVQISSNHPQNFFGFIEKAYAAEFDCVYAGWPSKRISGLCSQPRSNPAFQRETCSANEMPCQPLLFGRGICVSTATREQRQSAFANCDRKFRQSGRSLSDVVEYISDPEVSQDADELFQLVDQICTRGAQATTGMCRNLKDRVKTLQNSLSQVTPREEKIEEAPAVVVAELPTISVANPLVEAAENASSVTEIIENLNAVTRCESCESMRENLVDEPERNSAPARIETPTPNNKPYPRIDSGYDLAACSGSRGTPDGYEMAHMGDCRSSERVFRGYVFRPGPGHEYMNVQSRYPGGSKPGRFFEMVSRNEALNETYLVMEEYGGGPDSHNVKSHMFVIPRVTVPSVKVEGNNLVLTLPTGETVTMNKDTRQIINGAMTEGPIDLNTDRFQRKPPNIHYNGAGISIRLDHRYEHPLTGSATATVKQGNKTCTIPRTAILDQEGKMKTNSDQALLAVLNQSCRGGGFTLP